MEGFNHTEFFVTHNTKVILGVTCVEVHDTVHLDGKLAEDTVDWFAQDAAGNVWYFGENTGELYRRPIRDLDGTFTSGRRRRQAGHRHESPSRPRRFLSPGVRSR